MYGPDYYADWTEAKFQEAHKRFCEQCNATRTMTRETLVDYGRALNNEIIRRQEIVRVVQLNNEHQIQTLQAQFDGIAALLKYLPHQPPME